MTDASVELGEDGRLRVRGELSFNSVPALWESSQALFERAPMVDVDLSGVARSDSAGLAFLVECLRSATAAGVPIRFFNIPSQMLALARVSSLDHVLPLHHDD